MRSKIIVTTTTISILLAFATPANATVGLTESVYHNILADQNYGGPIDYSPTDTDIDEERSYTQGVAPDDTFINTATTFSYGVDQSTPTNAFLGADAPADLTDTAPVFDTAIDATGFITVSTPGSYTFNIAYADDAARVYVGGNIVAEQDFYYGGLNYGSSGSVNLSGSTSFELFYYQTQNGANLNFSVSGPGSVSYTTSGVPEPSTWAMLLLGFAGLGFAAHRRTARKNRMAFSAA